MQTPINSVLDRAPEAVRGVERVVASQVAPVGTFTVRRALPDRQRHSVGPWVFLDHFGPMKVRPGHDGVGAHPHAGIETVTYLLSGRNEHRDSAGHTGIVSAGGAQWMTAGRGIIHAERPLAENPAELTMHGIQLWTSLPRAHKLMAPRYQRLEAAAIPAVRGEGATARVIAGDLGGTRGAARTFTPVILWDVRLAAGATVRLPVPGGFSVAAYVRKGAVEAGGRRVEEGRLAIFAREGAEIELAAASGEGAELLVLGGEPIDEPVVQYGPFVMNTIDEIRAAIADFS